MADAIGSTARGQASNDRSGIVQDTWDVSRLLEPFTVA
jgi:hypothetical protein